MKIGEIKTVTKTYRTKKGNAYQIVAIELLDIPEDMKPLYKPVMYGTINHEYIGTDGRVNRILNLASMSIRNTIPDAIEAREDAEACDGMTFEELIAYFKEKAAVDAD